MGIWNRVKPDGSEDQVLLNIVLLRTELTGVALNMRTKAEVKANLESVMGEALLEDEAADLLAMATHLSTGTTEDRLVYAAKLEFALIAAASGLINETKFRTVLGI